MAGFRVQNQSLGMFNASPTGCSMTSTSGLCDQISDGMLIQPVSGLMGLAWQAQSTANVKPFWQALYESNVLDEPLMAFYLTRYQNVTGARAPLEPGGVFTLGLFKVPLHRTSGLITRL